MGGTNNNSGPIPCGLCGGAGYRTHFEDYPDTVEETEYVDVDDE
jgi:hypothetical protein